MEELRSTAFPLRTRAYSESDVIAVLLTRDHGKLSGIARGARRSKRRFAGPALEPFHEVEVRYKRRGHSELVFLDEGRLIASYDEITSRVEAFAWGSYVTELAEVIVPADEPCPTVYDLYRSTLAALARGDAVEPAAQHFVLRVLEHAGWCPDFERCAVCGATLEVGVRPIVDPRGGGVICGRHDAERRGDDPEDASFRPSRRVIDDALLDYVREARRAAKPDVESETLRAATALLDRLIALHVPRQLRTRRVLAELTQRS